MTGVTGLLTSLVPKSVFQFAEWFVFTLIGGVVMPVSSSRSIGVTLLTDRYGTTTLRRVSQASRRSLR